MSQGEPWIEEIMRPLSHPSLGGRVERPEGAKQAAAYNRIYEAVARGDEQQGRALVQAVLDYIDAKEAKPLKVELFLTLDLDPSLDIEGQERNDAAIAAMRAEGWEVREVIDQADKLTRVVVVHEYPTLDEAFATRVVALSGQITIGGEARGVFACRVQALCGEEAAP